MEIMEINNEKFNKLSQEELNIVLGGNSENTDTNNELTSIDNTKTYTTYLSLSRNASAE